MYNETGLELGQEESWVKILLCILPVRIVDTEMRGLDPSSITALVPSQPLANNSSTTRLALKAI